MPCVRSRLVQYNRGDRPRKWVSQGKNHFCEAPPILRRCETSCHWNSLCSVDVQSCWYLKIKMIWNACPGSLCVPRVDILPSYMQPAWTVVIATVFQDDDLTIFRNGLPGVGCQRNRRRLLFQHEYCALVVMVMTKGPGLWMNHLISAPLWVQSDESANLSPWVLGVFRGPTASLYSPSGRELPALLRRSPKQRSIRLWGSTADSRGTVFYLRTPPRSVGAMPFQLRRLTAYRRFQDRQDGHREGGGGATIPSMDGTGSSPELSDSR